MLGRILGRSKQLAGKSGGDKQAELKIGLVACKTGLLANYGLPALQGFELGIEYATQGRWQVAGRPIRLLVEDDAGDPALGEAKAQALVEQEGVHLLQACTSSGVSIKLARVAQEKKRLLMVAVAATGVLTGEWFNRYIFRTAANTFQDAAAGGKYAAEHLGKTFYFFSPDYIWGQQSRSAWWKVIEQYGGQIVGDTLVSPDEQDFRPYLYDVLAKRPDVLVPAWVGNAVTRLFLQMEEVGLLGQVKIAGNLVDRENILAAGKAMAGLTCAVKYHPDFPKNEVNAWLVARHQAKFGAPPDVFTESGFTSALALMRALTQTEGDPDPERLIPALEGMRFDGPKGVYTLRAEDHQALQPMYIAELVVPPGEAYCVPRLIAEVSAKETTPPLVKPR